VAQGAIDPSKFLEYHIILCFKKRYPKQNTVASLQSKNLPQKFFGTPKNFGLATTLISALTTDKGIAKKSAKATSDLTQTSI